MIGDELRKARTHAGMTQQALAERVGLTREYVSQIELDKRLPTIPVYVRICRALGLSTKDLVEMIDRIEWPQAAVTSRPGKVPVARRRLKR